MTCRSAVKLSAGRWKLDDLLKSMGIDMKSTKIKITSSVCVSQDISKKQVSKQVSVSIPRKSLNIEKELTDERNETTNRRLIKTQRLLLKLYWNQWFKNQFQKPGILWIAYLRFHIIY